MREPVTISGAGLPGLDGLQRLLAVALAVAFGAQSLRVFFVGLVAFLRDAREVSAVVLGLIALAVFSLVFLAGPLDRLLGTQRALWVTGGGLAVVRVLEQLVQAAEPDLILSAAGVVLFLLFVVVAIGRSRSGEAEPPHRFALAFLVGAAADTAILLAGGTLDLSWQTGPVPLVAVAAGAAALLWSLRSLADGTEAVDAGRAEVLGLAAIGPWFALSLLVFQNPAAVASFTGWSLTAAGALILVADVVGLTVAALTSQLRGMRRLDAITFGLLLVGASLPRDPSPFAPGWIAFGIVGGFALVGSVLGRSMATRGERGLRRTAVAFGVGQLLFVAIVFAFYASYDLAIGLRSGVVPVVAAVLVAVLAVFGASSLVPGPTSSRMAVRRGAALPIGVAVLFLLVPMAQALPTQQPTGVRPPPSSVVVVSYNLHNGTNTDGRLDPEALARVIEASGADIVGLQEVARGWLIWGGLDLLSWLADRLDMTYAWAPTADAQWGNAILSRYPLRAIAAAPLPPDSLLLRRGYLSAEVDTAGGSLRLITTHFTHIPSHDPERVEQATVLRDAWGRTPRTLVVGDLNTRPGSDAMRLLLEAGLVDVGAAGGLDGPTFPSNRPVDRIDYILASPDLQVTAVPLPSTTASDHLPVAARVTLP